MKTKKVYGPEGSTLNETIIKALQNDEGFREEYLKGLLTEKNISFLALSLKPVIDALGGVGKLAKETGLGRQNLYKVLTGKALPDFSTLLKIINYAGYDLSLQKIKTTKKRHSSVAFSN